MGCHFLLQRIFPTQGLNLGLPQCRQTLYRLSHKGSPINGTVIIWVTLASCLPLHLFWVYQPEHPWGCWASGPNPWEAPCVQDHVLQPDLQPRAPFQKSGAQNMCFQMPTCVTSIYSSRADRGETKPCIQGTSLPISQAFMGKTALSGPGVGVSLKALWLLHLLEVLQRWIPAASDSHLMSTVLCPAPRASTIVSNRSPKGNLGNARVPSLGLVSTTLSLNEDGGKSCLPHPYGNSRVLPGFNSWVGKILGEGNGNPLQYPCLENPMDGGAW